MGEHRRDPILRALSRQQWVRDHGTPRVSVLVGELAEAGASWSGWLRAAQRADCALTLVAARADLARIAAEAHTAAVEAPDRPIAIIVEPPILQAWLSSRDDRLAAFVAEGIIEVSCAPRVAAPIAPRPRSSAEAAMLAALEATAATAGRFQLNQALSFSFGDRAVEVDLLSRADEIAIEIDGYHHFTDPDHYRRDRRKDRLLQAHGYVVLRFLADDVLNDARAAADAVVELLGVRQGRAARQRRP